MFDYMLLLPPPIIPLPQTQKHDRVCRAIVVRLSLGI